MCRNDKQPRSPYVRGRYWGKIYLLQHIHICPNYQEDDFQKAEYKHIGGIVEGGIIKYYKLKVAQFTIGNIDLGSQGLWVTFDDRATDDVLGMDILKRTYFLNNKTNERLYFSLDPEEMISVLK